MAESNTNGGGSSSATTTAAADGGKKRALEQTLLTPGGEAAPCCGCGKAEVKYRCPRCERITCSLQCCLAHKKQFDCNGKRDRTKYVDIKRFTDADLSSDFFFLEEVSRSTNSAARSRSHLNANTRRPNGNKKRKVTGADSSASGSRAAPINPDIPTDWLMRFPGTVQLFAEHAAKRGVALTLLAPGMSKRARNSSYMNLKKKTLYWRVEWAFPSAEVVVNLVEERANDADTLFALLGRYLTPNQENVGIRGKLKKYAVAEWKKQVLFLLRKEFTPASQPQFYRLDGSQSLESNLKRKAIVEFPVITVALQCDADKYPVAHDIIEAVDSEEFQGDAVEAMEDENGVLNADAEDDEMEAEPSSEAEAEAAYPAAQLVAIGGESETATQPAAKPKPLLIEEVSSVAR